MDLANVLISFGEFYRDIDRKRRLSLGRDDGDGLDHLLKKSFEFRSF